MSYLDIPMSDRKIAELLKNKKTETGAVFAEAMGNSGGGTGDYVTKPELEDYPTKTDLESYASKSELDTLASKSELETYASKAELEEAAEALAAPITAKNMKTFRKALSQVRAGTGSARVLFVGDSTTWGVGTSGGGDLGYRASRTSLPARFATFMNSYYAPSRLTMAVPTSKNDTSATDKRWGPGAGWVLAYSGFGQMAAYQAPSGVVTPLTFTPDDTRNTDRFDIYWVRNTTMGTFSASVNGGTAVTVNTAGVGSVQKTTLTVPAGASNVLAITPTAGSVYIVGVDAYLSTESVIRVANAGVASSLASGWATTTSGGAVGSIVAYAPDLSVVMLGINDSKTPRTKAQFKTDLTTIVQRAQLSGDVILLSPIPSKSSGTVNSPDFKFQKQYRDAAKEISAELSCGFVDIFDRFETYEVADVAGFMSADGVHATDTGLVDIASALLAGIRTV